MDVYSCCDCCWQILAGCCWLDAGSVSADWLAGWCIMPAQGWLLLACKQVISSSKQNLPHRSLKAWTGL
jgi:hypothetical protein